MTEGSSKQAPSARGGGPTWSLALIARNEENMIGRVLVDASGLCDKLVVVDTGSTDATIEIAKEHGAQVHTFEWIDDFSAARNFAFDQCDGDWIVWLDADDTVPPAAQEGFRRLRAELAERSDIDGVMVPYHVGFAEQNPDICTYSYDRERVLRRDAKLRWMGPVHEVIALPAGRWMRWPDAWNEHRPPADRGALKRDRNLNILERSLKAGDRSPRNLFYYANELREHGDFEKAFETYLEYMTVSDLEWEHYVALLSISDCAAVLGRLEERLTFLFAAIALDSRRAEAFNKLGCYYYELRDWQRAIPFFAAAAALEKPSTGFVSDPDYEWVPLDYLAICLNESGRPREALEYTMRALITSTDRKRLLENIPFYLDKITEQEGGT